MSYPDYDEIVPGLYLGNIESTKDYNFLKRNNIKYVISLTNNYVKFNPNEIKHIHFRVRDAPYEDLISLFDICHSFINDGLSKGYGVLIHCDMGISRSSTIVISYLMKKMKKPFADVFRRVRLRRPKVNPNFGFQAQLLLFDKMNYTRHGNNPYHALYHKFSLNDRSNDELKFDVRGYISHLSKLEGGYKPPTAYCRGGRVSYACATSKKY